MCGAVDSCSFALHVCLLEPRVNVKAQAGIEVTYCGDYLKEKKGYHSLPHSFFPSGTDCSNLLIAAVHPLGGDEAECVLILFHSPWCIILNSDSSH